MCHQNRISAAARFGMWTLVSLASLWARTAPAVAQSGEGRKPAVEDRTLVTRDELGLKITYFRSEGGEDAPVVVLLHGKAGNRLVWKNFAIKLQEAGYAVVTVDLNGHGESKARNPKSGNGGGKGEPALRAADYVDMVTLDMDAVKTFLYDEHQKKQLNMNKLAIAGADFSTAVAVAFADVDWQKEPYDDAATFDQRTPRGQDVRALILLSPEAKVPGLSVSDSLSRLRTIPMPAMVGVGKGDTFDKGAARKVYEGLASKKNREVEPDERYVYLVNYDVKLRGTDLLNRPDGEVELNMFKFLEKHLKTVPSVWRDRRSREDRDDEK